MGHVTTTTFSPSPAYDALAAEYRRLDHAIADLVRQRQALELEQEREFDALRATWTGQIANLQQQIYAKTKDREAIEARVLALLKEGA